MEENKRIELNRGSIIMPQQITGLVLAVSAIFLYALRLVNFEWALSCMAGAAAVLIDADRLRNQMKNDWADGRQRKIWQDWPLWLRLVHAAAVGVFGAIVTLTFLDTVFFHGFDLGRLFNASVVVIVSIVIARFTRMDQSDIDENRPD